LSRVKGLSGLQLNGFNNTALEVDGLALKADLRFQELSKEVEDIFEEEVLEIKARNFVKKSGGISNKDEISENRKNLDKGKKVTKRSTYLITKQLIDKGHSLEDIVIERDLTLGTVSTHLIRIAELYPKTDLSRFKPDDKVLNEVKKARNKLLKENVSDLSKEDRRKISRNLIKIQLLTHNKGNVTIALVVCLASINLALINCSKHLPDQAGCLATHQ
jgi:uncharacterized protein YpbB